jgi:MFS family permease
MMISISFSPLIGEISGDLGIGLGKASFGLMGLHTLATAIGIGLYGFVIDRVGVFPVIIVSLIFLFVSSVLIPVFASLYPALVAIRVAQGFFGAGLTASITPAIARWFPRHEMGRAMGFPTVGSSFGMMLGLAVSPMLVSFAGSWQIGLALLSGMVLLSLLFTIPVAIRSKRYVGYGSREKEPTEFVPLSKAYFRAPLFWVGLFIMALAMWTNLTFTDLCPGFLAVSKPVGAAYGAQMAGRLMSLPSAAGMFGALIAGFLVDKVFHGKNRFAVMIGWIISAVFYTSVLFSFVHENTAVLVPVLLISGLQNPFVNVAVMSFAAKMFSPNIVGRIGGLWISVSFFAGSAGVMVGSIALHETGTYQLSFLILAVASMIGLAITPMLKDPNK